VAKVTIEELVVKVEADLKGFKKKICQMAKKKPKKPPIP